MRTSPAHTWWCKACLYGMTDSFKSLRWADVVFVPHRDTSHVNCNSNLDFSPDEHFRLDSCGRRITEVRSLIGGTHQARRYQPEWHACDRLASLDHHPLTCERGVHWLGHIQNPNNSMWIFARQLVSAFGNNQKEKSRFELRVEIWHRRHVNVVFPDQPPRGQQSLKLYIFFSLLLKIKKSKHIFSLSTQDLCAKGTERLLPGIDPWHMQVSESAVLQIPAQRVLSPPCGAVIIVFDILYFSKTP